MGGSFREEVTWDKAKALPWAKRGELRDVVERALLFSKTDAYRFDTTAIRSPEPQSIWWQRYPERYAPNGTLPTNVWTIPHTNPGRLGRGSEHITARFRLNCRTDLLR